MDSDGVERRLAAILSADVAGYSRLMADDEVATLRTLTAHRDAISQIVERHRGRVVDAPGDNLLAEFSSATEAVRAAVEAQRVVAEGNAALPAARRMVFRMGVHLGDVVVEGAHIYGDGVNIAARLEALAEPGGVCISGAVHSQVRNRADLAATDLGMRTVKNIPEPVRVFALGSAGLASTPARRRHPVLVATTVVVLLVAAALFVTWPRPLGLLLDAAGLAGPPANPPLPDVPSIAVLPFTNMSDDPDQEYFSDGISEDLTTDLSKVPGLFVISRSSAFTYKDRSVKVEDIGRELGVRYVLEGSVRRSKGRVRVTAQLIDATSGFHLWSERYDRELSDIFELQSEITREILSSLRVEFREQEVDRVFRRPTHDVVAYDSFLRGYSHFQRFRREDNALARGLFERAIELDPKFAEAVAMLGISYVVEYALLWNLNTALLDRGDELGLRALALDPATAPAHALLAQVSLFRNRPDRAVEEAERAVELAPNFDPPRVTLAAALVAQRRYGAALQALNHAMRLNPRAASPTSVAMGVVHHATGRTDEAIALWERARAENPDQILPRLLLAVVYASSGRDADARVLIAEVRRVNPGLNAAALEGRTFLSSEFFDATALERAGLR